MADSWEDEDFDLPSVAPPTTVPVSWDDEVGMLLMTYTMGITPACTIISNALYTGKFMVLQMICRARSPDAVILRLSSFHIMRLVACFLKPRESSIYSAP